MIVTNRSHVQFRGVTCTREFDYYATATGAVMCRTSYTPVDKQLRHLRGHSTCQLLNLAFALSVRDCMMLLGLQLDHAPAAELFAALADSDLRADGCARDIAEWLNA